MARRLRVGVLFGGRSGEHEISLRSAIAVLRALDPKRYEAVPIAITRRGQWFTSPDLLDRLDRAQRRFRPIPAHGTEVSILAEPTRRGLVFLDTRSPRSQRARSTRGRTERLDVVFPVLHGTYGEDGTIQGLFELAGIPYVGAGVVGSAVGMDKDVMKRLLRDADIPICRFLTLRGAETTQPLRVVDRIAELGLGYPCFVKPANLGSSVGITRVSRAEQLPAALREARRYDTKIIVEEEIVGREFEIGVLGNLDADTEPMVSVPGEVVPGRAFYDYVDKYVGGGASTVVPAHLTQDLQHTMAAVARRAYRALDCDGLARVDFFLRADDEVFVVNEINTMPGMTPISLFPQMWEASGITFPQVVDRLITLARARHAHRAQLSTAFSPGARSPSATRSRRGRR
jgi:D-alanine-D-alanine ligase